MVALALSQTADERQGVTLTVVLEHATGNWCAYTPDDIGVIIATGATREETINQFRSALRSHLRLMHDEGLSVPNVMQIEVRETLRV